MGFVLGVGLNYLVVMLVGEVFGCSEIDSWVFFSGILGKELIKLLEEIGLLWVIVYIILVVCKWLYLVKVVIDKKIG